MKNNITNNVINTLQVEHLTKKWKNFTLSDINFQLEPGFILGLIGKNGAGKTTLISAILGNVDYEEGKIFVMDYSYQREKNLGRSEIGWIVEPAPFFPSKSLLVNGEILGGFYDKWDELLFRKQLFQYGLNGDALYMDLSKGMQTRFQLAFALAHHPRLLVMDEPTGGLDPVFRREFLSILQAAVRDTEVSVVISTHLTTDLDKIADYIMMLDEGKQVLYMDKESLMDSYPLLQGSCDKLQLLPQDVCGRVKKRGNHFSTILQKPEYLKEHQELWQEFQIERTNLEEMMYYLSKSEFDAAGEA